MQIFEPADPEARSVGGSGPVSGGQRGVSAYSWGGPVRVGTVLPDDGVTDYAVPTEYRTRPGYRSTIVNEQPVLVDRSHRIVEVID